MELITTDIIIAASAIVGSAAITKYKVSESNSKIIALENAVSELKEFMNSNKPMLQHFSRIENAYGNKIDEHSGAIVELHQKTSQAPTMNEVRAEFVSKEMFTQMEKHIDEKFNKLDNELDKIDNGIKLILNRISQKGWLCVQEVFH